MKPVTAAGDNTPAGRCGPAVRGLAASMSRSTSRLNAIAALRAKIMQSVTPNRSHAIFPHSASVARHANTAAISANGSANTVWLNRTSPSQSPADARLTASVSKTALVSGTASGGAAELMCAPYRRRAAGVHAAGPRSAGGGVEGQGGGVVGDGDDRQVLVRGQVHQLARLVPVARQTARHPRLPAGRVEFHQRPAHVAGRPQRAAPAAVRQHHPAAQGK